MVLRKIPTVLLSILFVELGSVQVRCIVLCASVIVFAPGSKMARMGAPLKPLKMDPARVGFVIFAHFFEVRFALQVFPIIIPLEVWWSLNFNFELCYGYKNLKI